MASTRPPASEGMSATCASRKSFIGRACASFHVLAKETQAPLSNRACRFPAHGLPMVSRAEALCRHLDANESTASVRHTDLYVHASCAWPLPTVALGDVVL